MMFSWDVKTRFESQLSRMKPQSRAKFYVALTRGRHSVAVAMDWETEPLPAGFSLYKRAAPS